MVKNYESKNGTSPTEEKETAKKIPIIDTLKPKKRLTKDDKEMIKAFEAAMDAITREKNAEV